MAKVIVVYESKHGNTKLVAETIIEGISEIEGIEFFLCDASRGEKMACQKDKLKHACAC